MSLVALFATLLTVSFSEALAQTCASLWSFPTESAESLEFRTGRLELHPLELADAPEVARISSHPLVASKLGYSARADVGFHRDEISKLRSSLKDLRRDKSRADLGIFHEGKLIGSVSVAHQIEFISRERGSASRYEIGYMLDPIAQGQGFAREAVERVVRFLFTDGKALEVRAEVFESNKPSRRLLESLGFKVLIRNLDTIIYEMTASLYAETDRLEWKTDRLVLRALSRDYAKQAYEMMAPAGVAAKLGKTVPKSVSESETAIIELSDKKSNLVKGGPISKSKSHLGIFKDGELIGMIFLQTSYWAPTNWNRLHPNLLRHYLFVGYVVRPEFQRQGYVFEALKRVVQVAFDEFGTNDIFASVFDGNVASHGVLRKSGFTKFSRQDGTTTYRLVRSAWLRNRLKKFFLKED